MTTRHNLLYSLKIKNYETHITIYRPDNGITIFTLGPGCRL